MITSFSKSFVSENVVRPHVNVMPAFSNSSGLKRFYNWKALFWWRISVHSRSNRRNKAAFSNSKKKTIERLTGRLKMINLMPNISVKPWLNGLASRRKLKTWVYLRLRLARAWVQLRWLAMTRAPLVEIKFARKLTQVFHRLARLRAVSLLLENP